MEEVLFLVFQMIEQVVLMISPNIGLPPMYRKEVPSYNNKRAFQEVKADFFIVTVTHHASYNYSLLDACSLFLANSWYSPLLLVSRKPKTKKI